MSQTLWVFVVGLVLAFFSFTFSTTSAAIVETSFHVKNLNVNRLCQNQVIVAVNGSLPGPTLTIKEGDTLVVHVFNKSPYNLTIHWHGVFQTLTPWADGPEFITQCPIRPGGNYTYRFNLVGQVGTLWWHAHSQWLRATVYGALVIHPRDGQKYPFVKPYGEDTILLGEWWNANPIDVENAALVNGTSPVNSDAYTINGWPGDRFNSCRPSKIYRLDVVPGKTYLLRIINAALNAQFFFKVANHNLTVVGADAAYTNPFPTDVVVIGPGQTTDVLLTANQSPGLYYMAAHPYASAAGVSFNANTTTAILAYQNAAQTTPILPVLPDFNDTPTAFTFSSNLTALVSSPFWSPVPKKVDEDMFVTIGLGLSACGSNQTCGGITSTQKAFLSGVRVKFFISKTPITSVRNHHHRLVLCRNHNHRLVLCRNHHHGLLHRLPETMTDATSSAGNHHLSRHCRACFWRGLDPVYPPPNLVFNPPTARELSFLGF
ncbi:hypothetical protein QVD17_33615 [Tagetes erecta]|uniref:laccase n=1 Tax=Tagetes erecta TaxID=13708 RepID=A0AAD8NE12_TARER|nr:hypothetical protein QVD17_33615 [Tagetes erecta]